MRGVGWWVNTSASSSPFLALFVVIRAVRGDLGGWGLRGLVGQALVLLAFRRLGGIGQAMERLVARFQAGRVWRRAAGVSASRQSAMAARRPECVLPRRFGWLVRAAAYQAAGHGCRLQAVLATPEMEALLRATPQAGRLLRPLCRMLAVDPALLRPDGAVQVAVAGPVVVEGVGGASLTHSPRSRTPRREAADFGRIALPRGVLAAARHQGFGKR